MSGFSARLRWQHIPGHLGTDEALPPDERARLAAYGHPEPRRQSLNAYLLGQALLDEVCGLGAAVLRHDSAGRPIVDGVSAGISLSHAKTYVAAAVLPGGRVGVDIEVVRDVRPTLVERTCHPLELRAIGSDVNRFFQLWTLKESWMKATGVGLSEEPSQLCFHVTPQGISLDGQPQWSFHSEQVVPGVWLALCEEVAAGFSSRTS